MVEALHMVGGDGPTSYAANSLLQRKAMLKAIPRVRQAIKDVVASNNLTQIAVADLGCSSGDNTLLTILNILNTISGCFQSSETRPDVQFFLNDLPGNDFNYLFQSLIPLRKTLTTTENDESFSSLYVFGAPGSFYERIFPDASLHFIHSSYSLHFLSQEPIGILNKKYPTTCDSYIYLRKSTPFSVVKSYKEQYHVDFTLFLTLRAKEIIAGGYMALLFLGRTNPDPTTSECSYLWEALADALIDMVEEGLVDKIDLVRFKLPFYSPSLDEVKEIINDEKSFDIEIADTFQIDWDPYLDESGDNSNIMYDDITCGENVAKYVRAVMEPILLIHFKGINIDDTFSRFARKVARLPKENRKYLNIMLVLKKSSSLDHHLRGK